MRASSCLMGATTPGAPSASCTPPHRRYICLKLLLTLLSMDPVYHGPDVPSRQPSVCYNTCCQVNLSEMLP